MFKLRWRIAGNLEPCACAGLVVYKAVRAGSEGKFPLAVSVANGDAGYYPTREMFEQYPSIFDSDDFGSFGFYEVWFGPRIAASEVPAAHR